ncbi:MAG: DUF4931 domain-containing protein [Candidatus Yanofskybacteria bacterium]|nr:DUF4931 domain-containing protein [Candidatus Yanofskybacteria bacterium]
MAEFNGNHKWYKAAQTPSELRYDVISRGWVAIATGRARKPGSFQQEKKQQELNGKESCPFEDLTDQEAPTAAFFKGKQVELPSNGTVPEKWTTISLLNKYPAFIPQENFQWKTNLIGPYQIMEGVGFHEVVITKHHQEDISQFSQEQTKELIDVYHARYLELQQQDFVHYIAIFKNKGKEAGASIAHPHSQIIAIPATSPGMDVALQGLREFHDATGTCAYCAMISWDIKDESRVIYENEHFVALCPFASRVAFEARIYPKEHAAHFEGITEQGKWDLALALQKTLRAISKGLGDPDYNYFIHTAPPDGGEYALYHWHIEILPKTGTWAGFELGTGIEISTIEPEKAAEFLRKQ